MSTQSSWIPTTPPTYAPVDQLQARRTHNRAASTSSLYYDSSPSSVFTPSPASSIGTNASTVGITTAHSTPATKPSPARLLGPALIPRIRDQDQVIEPASLSNPGPVRSGHRRALSTTVNPPATNRQAPYHIQRPAMQRTVSQPIDCGLLSPISVPSIVSSRIPSAMNSPVSARRAGGHSRSSSASSVDESVMQRCGYGLYRYLQQHNSLHARAHQVTTPLSYVTTMSPTVSGLTQSIVSTPTTAQMIGPEAYTYPASPQYSPAFTQMCMPSPALLPSALVREHRPNLLTGLTASTQSINVVDNMRSFAGHGRHNQFWWDIRNLRRWSSFSIDGFKDVPNLMRLLTMPLSSESAVPNSSVPPQRLHPDSESALTSLIYDIYCPRVNSALAVSQGLEHHLSLRRNPEAVASGSNAGAPDFLANYPSDTEKTRAGSPRGRAVGLVKSYTIWNTGMRNERPQQHVEYLKGLSHLQQCMREHNCRYGFIITEIELVCVRAGTDEHDAALFGYLELSTPIRHAASVIPEVLRREGMESVTGVSTGDTADAASHPIDYAAGIEPDRIQMTTSLALYFLLMLCRQQPLPNHPAAHLDVRDRSHVYVAPADAASSNPSSRDSSTGPDTGFDLGLNLNWTGAAFTGSTPATSAGLMPMYDPFTQFQFPAPTSQEPSLLPTTSAAPSSLPNYAGTANAKSNTKASPLESRDSWMPAPQKLEMRAAKLKRGWVWPSDPWSSKEGRNGTGGANKRLSYVGFDAGDAGPAGAGAAGRGGAKGKATKAKGRR